MDATPQTLEKMMMTANLHRMRGEWNEAEVVIRFVIQRYPEDAFAQEFLGDILVQKGDTAEAEAVYRHLLQQHPGRAGTEEKLARLILKSTPVSLGTVSGSSLRSDRNPTTVAVLSLVFPGAGHYYLGDKVKGLLFTAATFLLMFAFVPVVFSAMAPIAASVSSGLSPTGLEEGGGLQAPAVSANVGWQSLLLTLLMCGLYAYSTYDAYTTARRVYRR